MSQKNFDEYFAKVVLEYCFPEKFTDLQISDKPDLRCDNKIGIEVTNCIPKEVFEGFKLWRKVIKQGGQVSPRIKGRLEQLKDFVDFDGKSLIWKQGSSNEDILSHVTVQEFVKAVAKKVERLNSVNANYAEMNSYELFVNSAIYISSLNEELELLERLKELNEKPKKFDNIHVITLNQKLLTFDMVNKTLGNKEYLYARLELMAEKAKELYIFDK